MHSEGYGSCCVCVCVSVHGSNLLVAQLRDKLVILTGSVSWSLQNNLAFFSCNGFVSKIAIAIPYFTSTWQSAIFYTLNGLIFRIPSVDCTRAVNFASVVRTVCSNHVCKWCVETIIRPSVDCLEYRDGTVHISREMHKQHTT